MKETATSPKLRIFLDEDRAMRNFYFPGKRPPKRILSARRVPRLGEGLGPHRNRQLCGAKFSSISHPPALRFRPPAHRELAAGPYVV